LHQQLVVVALVITQAEMDQLAVQAVVVVHLTALVVQEPQDKVMLVAIHKFSQAQAVEWAVAVAVLVVLEQLELMAMLEMVALA
jgi:hypothetical protein